MLLITGLRHAHGFVVFKWSLYYERLFYTRTDEPVARGRGFFTQ